MASGDSSAPLRCRSPAPAPTYRRQNDSHERRQSLRHLGAERRLISNGQLADIVIAVAKKTHPRAKRDVADRGRGPIEPKAFSAAATSTRSASETRATSELFFSDVRVPTSTLLGREEGAGFAQLMQQLPQERLTIAGVTTTERALELTIAYAKERNAFGQRLIDFQRPVQACRVQDRGDGRARVRRWIDRSSPRTKTQLSPNWTPFVGPRGVGFKV